jgi:hypothetical protein
VSIPTRCVCEASFPRSAVIPKSIVFSALMIGLVTASLPVVLGGIMQMAITFMAVVAGLIFSIAVALLAEELIFGQVFRLFFVRQPVAMKTGQKR